MTMTVELNSASIDGLPRKHKNIRTHTLRSVPSAMDNHPVASVHVPKTRINAPSAVDLARSTSDADAQAALAKLRELVVGPTQQLNEARLEELIKIFEEREAELRALLRDVQKRNSELEIALKQNFIEQMNSFKSEFLSLTDSMMSENKKACASIRDEISASRKETLDLVHDTKAVAEQKILVQSTRLESLVKSEVTKLQTEINEVDNSLKAAQFEAQTETHNSISRVLKEAADNLSRAVAVA